MRASHLSLVLFIKVATEFQFEAVLGKTQRTEFKRGARNVMQRYVVCARCSLLGDLRGETIVMSNMDRSK